MNSSTIIKSIIVIVLFVIAWNLENRLMTWICFSLGFGVILYPFQKTNDNDFNYPYKDLGKTPARDTVYNPAFFYNSTPSTRSYIPTDINSLSGKMILKILIKKIFSKFK